MIHFAPCKINLGLHVLSGRDDGYHNIETCFFPVPWYDALEIIPSKDDVTAFSQTGISIPGKDVDNLVMKAYELLSKDFALTSCAIHLHKVIPTGAGLGGGSSDGAGALVLLNRIFNLNLSATQLLNYASRLGSDCAFFIESVSKIGKERGDVLENVTLDLSGKYLVIVKPEVNVSTVEAYASLRLRHHENNIRAIVEGDMGQWRDLLKNDFEENVFKKYPELEGIKSALYKQGAEYASMSGSGSAVFGIFERPVEIQEFRGSVVWSGMV